MGVSEEGLSSSLSINGVAIEDGGRYLCVVEVLSEGRTVSADAFITVKRKSCSFLKAPIKSGFTHSNGCNMSCVSFYN